MNLFEKLFGFALGSSKDDDKAQDNLKTFIPPSQRDGAITIDQQQYGYGGYFYSTPYQANRLANEFELITKYRQMALHPIVAKAIEEICNETIVPDEAGSYKLFLNLDACKVSEDVKVKMLQCFDEVLKLCNYSTDAYDIFRQSYIDGKLYNAIIINDEKKEEGIQDIRLFDPRQIQLVRHITRDPNSNLSAFGNSAALVSLIDDVEEFFVFNPYGIYQTYVNSAENITGIRIETDSVSYVTSGLMDAENQIVISFLEQASKVLNQLSDLEDSMVIYRMSRSSEKRIFYVSVGKMSHSKASSYLRAIAEKYKTKVVYDPTTGKVDIGNNQRSLVEDYFIPVRDGNDGTKIETLEGGQALDSIPDLEYFWRLLTKSLNVPATRLQESSAYSIGKSSEITRDEISFKKFITRLQLRFGEFPLQLLRTQLELKGIISGTDFDKIKDDIILNFATDNFFYEMKEAEILSIRAATANDISSANEIHQIFSSEWIKKRIFKLTDEEIKQNDIQIKAERIKRAEMGIENQEEENAKSPGGFGSRFGGAEKSDGGKTDEPSVDAEVDAIEDADDLPIEKEEDVEKVLNSISKFTIDNAKKDKESDESNDSKDEDSDKSDDSEEEEKDDVDESKELLAKYIKNNINN